MYPDHSDINYALDLMQHLFDIEFENAISYIPDQSGKWTYRGVADWKDKHYFELYDLGICMDWGETKVCLIIDDFDWVIKVAFKRDMDRGFNSKIDIKDYCAREAENYLRSQELGLDKYFAATYEVGFIGTTPIYLQERVDCNSDSIEDSLYEYSDRENREWIEEQYDDEDDIKDRIYSYADELEDDERIRAILGYDDEIERLIDFTYENDIGDLHSKNWGFNQNGFAVILDFSGYNVDRREGE